MNLQNTLSMETKNYSGNFVIILLCDIHDIMKLFAFLLRVMRMWKTACFLFASKPTLWALHPWLQSCRKTQMSSDMDMPLSGPLEVTDTNSSGRWGYDLRWPSKNNKS